MKYSFIFNDLCQTAKNSVRCVTNHNAQFHICSQLLCCLAWHAIPFKNLTRLLIITQPRSFLKARPNFPCKFYLKSRFFREYTVQTPLSWPVSAFQCTKQTGKAVINQHYPEYDQHGMSAGSVLITHFVRHFKVTDLSVSFDQTDLRDPIVHFDALDTSESDVSINT